MFSTSGLDIFSNRIPIDIVKEHLLTFPHNLPSYLKKIPQQFGEGPHGATVKKCSGMINIFKRTILFTSPFDIEIIFKPDGSWKAFVGSSDLGDNTITQHDNRQLLSHIDTKYKVLLKLSFEINMKCKYPIYVHAPWWHFTGFDTIPGVINCKDPLGLNVFLPVEKKTMRIFIKQHTPLYYLNVETHKKVKLNFKKEKIDTKNYKGLDYVFSSLPFRLLKNKFFKKNEL